MTDDVPARIAALVDDRPGLDGVWALAFAQALAVPCRSCGAGRAVLCRNLRTGEPLGRLVAHTVRLRDGGAELGESDPRELARGAKSCGDAEPRQGCPVCHPPRSRSAGEWPDVPPPRTQAADDQGWRR